MLPLIPLNLASQTGRQASALLPPREGSNLSQAGRQAVASLPSGEGSNSTQAGAHLPSREVSSSLQAGDLLLPLGKEAIYLRQAGTLLPPGEGSNSSQVGSQASSLLPNRGGSILPRQLLTFLPGEGSNSPSATAHLSYQGRKQFFTGNWSTSSGGSKQFLPGTCSPSLQGSQAVLPRQLLTFLLGKVTVLPSQPPFLPPGREVAIFRQAIKLGQAGRALGILPGIGHPRLPRGTALPPRQTVLTPWKATQTLPSPVGSPRGLLMKNLTISGSLTYPAKPLTPAQRSVLAKRTQLCSFPQATS